MNRLQIRHQVVRDAQDRVRFRRFSAKGNDHYQLTVWIEADDRTLDSIDHVVYLLHETFKRPKRKSDSRSNKFAITLWTWGQFDIEVCIHFRDGKPHRETHALEYKLPAETGTNYVEVE